MTACRIIQATSLCALNRSSMCRGRPDLLVLMKLRDYCLPGYSRSPLIHSACIVTRTDKTVGPGRCSYRQQRVELPAPGLCKFAIAGTSPGGERRGCRCLGHYILLDTIKSAQCSQALLFGVSRDLCIVDANTAQKVITEITSFHELLATPSDIPIDRLLQHSIIFVKHHM